MSLNTEVFENIQVSSHEYVILKSVEDFYQNPNIINKFLKILNGDIHKYQILNNFNKYKIFSQNQILDSIEYPDENVDSISTKISDFGSTTLGYAQCSSISIRLIDYFVTKYSKNHKVTYKVNNNILDNNYSQVINVYNSYKQQLKAYQKKHFDPFSRGYRIPYFLNDTCIITTISQLNFFKWFFSNGLYEYILEFHNKIENEMNTSNKIKIEKKPKMIKKKLKQNYNTYIPSTNMNNINNIVVSFSI